MTTTKLKNLPLPFLCRDIAFKAVFTGEENILAKLVSSITDIDYWYLKDNLIFETNEIPISKKNEKAKRCDFILRMTNNNVISLEINTSYYSGMPIKNLAYICGIYSKSTKRKEKYDDKFIAYQINLDCYNDNKNDVLEKYLLQEVTNHKVYTSNLSIFNLNVVKCSDIYYNCDDKEDIPDYIRWGTLIYTRDFNKIPDIAKNILTKKEVKIIMDKIKKLHEDSLFMSESEALEWEEWEKKSIMQDGINQGLVEGSEKKTKEIVLAMVNNKLPIDTISKVTNKTIKEINDIITEF